MAIIMPIPVIIPPKNNVINPYPKFIENYDGGYFNISASTECGVYESSGKWWIWFKINGNYKYFLNSFKSKEEASIYLLKILESEK